MKRKVKQKVNKESKSVSLKGEELYLSLQKQWKNSMSLRRSFPKGKN